MTELLRRVAGVVILDASEDVSGIAAALELPRTSPGQPKDGSLVALAWVEPTTQDFVRLAEARRWLAPGGRLFLVVGGALAGYLAERKAGPSLDYLDERTVLRGLARQGFRITERLGLHGVRAVAWHLLGLIAGWLGRPAWQDRCHFAMRRDFVASRGPAALVCLTAEMVA